MLLIYGSPDALLVLQKFSQQRAVREAEAAGKVQHVGVAEPRPLPRGAHDNLGEDGSGRLTDVDHGSTSQDEG